MTQGPTRIGFIGAGAVAQRHASVLDAFDDVQVAAVTDVADGPAEALAAQSGARRYADADAMLDGADLHAVYVCVPPFAHGEPERAVIAAGLPLFVEKPLARDLQTAEELGARVAERSLITATGYHWRYLDVVEQARAALADRPARLANAIWLDKVPPPGWWTSSALSGGQTVEQTTHVLDVLRALVGEVVEVSAQAARFERPAFPDSDVADASTALLRFASGAIGTVVSSCLPARKAFAGVELVADGLHLRLSELDLQLDEGDGPHRVEDPGQAKVQVDRDFVDAVRGGPDRIRVPYGEALRTHRLACALERSAREGRPVALDG